jgi:hypothetical protein
LIIRPDFIFVFLCGEKRWFLFYLRHGAFLFVSASRERDIVRRLERVAQVPGVVQLGFKFELDLER